MAQTKGTKRPDRDLITRLADAGEDAMQRIGELPGGKALVDTAQTFRERLDDLATRIRAIDPLERRVTQLEARMAALEKKAPRRAARATRKPSTKTTTTKTTP